MAFCGSCGAQMQDGAANCTACGARAGAPAPAAASAGSGGMDDNIAGALTYIPFVIGLIISIIFLVIEPMNKKRFVRFHAFQSLFLHGALFCLWIVWWIVTIFIGIMSHGFGLGAIFSLLWFVMWLGILVLLAFMMFQAYSKKEFKLPVIGDLAAKQAGA
jgi:uncharacterized membrane protein